MIKKRLSRLEFLSYVCLTLCSVHIYVISPLIGMNSGNDQINNDVSYNRLTWFLEISQMRSPEKEINRTELEMANHLFQVPDDLWPPTKALLVNSSVQRRWKILHARKIYLTYGENCCSLALTRACDAALSVGKMDECRAHNSSVIDNQFKLHQKQTLASYRGAGLWLWKPYIINRTLHEMADGEYLVYADAGAFMKSPIHPVLLLLEKLDVKYSGVLVFGVGLPQRSFCKRDSFIRQHCDTPACHDAGQINGAFSIWRRGPHALRVVQAWLQDCEDSQVRFESYAHHPCFNAPPSPCPRLVSSPLRFHPPHFSLPLPFFLSVLPLTLPFDTSLH